MSSMSNGLVVKNPILSKDQNFIPNVPFCSVK